MSDLALLARGLRARHQNKPVPVSKSPSPQTHTEIVAFEERSECQFQEDQDQAADEVAAFEERAAVIEHDGDVPRAWAEALARLDPSRPPADVPPKRWVLFLNDCGAFADSAWVNRAIDLGWTPLDLFGCHETKPYARLSHCGLLWLLKGRRILSMDTDRVVIETETGSVVYRRVPTEPSDMRVGIEGRRFMSKDIGQEFGLDPQDVAKEVTETKRKYRGVSSIHIVRDNELLRVAGK